MDNDNKVDIKWNTADMKYLRKISEETKCEKIMSEIIGEGLKRKPKKSKIAKRQLH